MRLLLSGGGSPDAVVPLDELFISQIDIHAPTLYIPVAMEPPYNECLNWFQKTYQPYGLRHVEMCTDLSSIQNLSQYTAIFIGGGNTFKLLNTIKNSRFDSKLLEYLNNNGLVYGGSAGAIIFGSSIKTAEYADVNSVGLNDLSGLNLTGGKDIFRHYSHKDNQYIRDYHNDLFILYEESGLFIRHDTAEPIGKPYLTRATLESEA